MKNLMGINKKQKFLFLSALIVFLFFSAVFPLPFTETKSSEAQIVPLPGADIAIRGIIQGGQMVAEKPKEFAEGFAEGIASWIGKFIIMLAGWVLGLAGLLLNYTLDYTIVEMAQRVRDLPVITDAWGTFRDLANIFFIFIILYIAIMTILRMDTATTKKLLVHVIIIALLINFSLFFTKALIDASNIVATSFYNQIEEVGVSNTGEDLGLSGAFMRQLGLESAFNLAGAEKLLSAVNGPLNILLVAILSFFLFMVVAFVFAAAAILLTIRFVVLIFLMILSPLAFAAMALPKDDWSKKWWDALISQAIFAPIFLALIWVTILVLNGLTNGGTNLGESLTRIIPDGLSGSNEEGFVEGLLKDKMAIIFNFIVVIGMAAFSIVAAKLIGVQGGAKAVSLGQKWASNSAKRMGSAPARHLVGRGATMADRALGGTRFGQTAVGSMLRAPLTGLSKSKFGGKGPSGADFQKARDKRRDAFAKIEVEKAKKAGEKAEQEVVEQRSQRMATVEASPDKGKAGRIGRTYQAELDRIEQEKIDTVAVGARTQEEAEEEAGRQIMEARKKYLQEMKKLRERYKQRNTNAQIKGAQVKKAVMEQRAEELERPRGVLRQTFSFSNKEQRIAAAKAIRTGKAPGQNIESVIRDILDEEKGGKDKGSDKDKK